ncbi:acryloyl-CoA reductase [Nocardioides sp.]|uniref:acrylyl-CoA reductase family protein n=1 Tax=Nocardioides sp. TaxID=35761 RepID=UPI00263405DF|nr:acryloyl-CoA reductase [Nocardioides sp.]MDI6912311.1 acryloyl-CoA reductase [Nocardioides sp.]
MEFRALVSEPRDGADNLEIRTLQASDLPDEDLLIRVTWSSVNYKDALAATADGQVAEIPCLVTGIDLAGEVVEGSGRFAAGDSVIVHGYGLGTKQHGGHAEYARVPSSWALPLPAGMSARDAMALGTAGWTAADAILQLMQHGMHLSAGPVLVTGASGGVGAVAMAILKTLGYEEIVACSRKPEQEPMLRALGASEVVSPSDLDPRGRPLVRERWSGVIDTVGGELLASLLPAVRYGGGVAVCGMAGGFGVKATVLPFIIRAVSVLGVNSVDTPLARRAAVWQRLAEDLAPSGLESIVNEIDLERIPEALTALLGSSHVGRTVVRIG